MLQTVLILCIWLTLGSASTISPEVTRIEPRVGSVWGATRITLYGSGFSSDQFSLGNDPDVGNSVILKANDSQSFTCAIHRDGCTTVQITCDTPRNMWHNKYYYPFVKVDGTSIPDSRICGGSKPDCSFKPHNYWTPTIDHLNWTTVSVGAPLKLLNVSGRIVTNKYGTDIQEADNGRREAILRLKVRGDNCELKDDKDKFFGTGLMSNTSWYGWLLCNMTGTYVGYSNISLLISGPFGRAKLTEQVSHVSPSSKMYNVQTYTEITKVTPQKGSKEGGANVTIQGYNFETNGTYSTYLPMEVYIGGVLCEGLQVTPDGPASVIAPAEVTGSLFEGNRGLRAVYWNSGSYADPTAIFDTTDTPSGAKWLDQATFYYDDPVLSPAGVYVKLRAYFITPWDGNYAFFLRSKNAAAFRLDDETLISTPAGDVWRQSARFNLVKGTRHLMQVAAMPGNESGASVDLKFRHYNTILTEKMTPSAKQEQQQVRFRSSAVGEEVALTFSGFDARSNQSQIQTLCPNGEILRLCVWGACTIEPVDFSQSEQVAKGLNGIPVWASGDAVSAIPNEQDSTCVDVTFHTKIGNIPLVTSGTKDVKVNATVKRDGIPSNTMFAVMYEGTPSPFVEYNETDKAAFATKLQEMFEDAFSVRCPPLLLPSGVADFEDENKDYGEADIVTGVWPFSGRKSCRNCPIFPTPGSTKTEFSTLITPYLCMAVKDLENSDMYVSYESPSGFNGNNRHFTFSGMPADGGWTYFCANLNTLVSSENPEKAGENYKVTHISFSNPEGVDFYTDAISIARSPTLADLSSSASLADVRLGPASLKFSEQTLVETVTVEFDERANQYNVTIAPHNCASELALPVLANSYVTEGAVAFPSSTVATKLNGTDAVMAARSLQRATPALSGKVTISIDGDSTGDIDVQDTDTNIKRTIESTSNFGEVTVISSSDSTCSNRDILFKFESLRGDQTTLVVGGTSSLEPNGAFAEVTTQVDGHVEVSPILGDYMRTVETKPQVVAIVNGVPSKCQEGTDCSYEFDASATPSVTGLSSASGSTGDTLTIQGTDLSASAIVTIGGVPCFNPSGSSTSVQCTVGDCPSGKYPVVVNVPGSGLATGSFDFTCVSSFTGISANVGGLGGGLIITAKGNGFSVISNVFFGDALCVRQEDEVDPDEIVCKVPPFTTLSATTDQAVTVTVKEDGIAIAGTDTFTYRPSLTAYINTLSHQNPMPVTGGQIIEMTGSNFGENLVVSLGGQALTVDDSSNSSSVVATTPDLVPGTARPLELFNGNGNAILASVGTYSMPAVDVTLRVDAMWPDKGSTLGGQRVTLIGWGFGTVKENIEVSFEGIDSQTLSVTNTQIVVEVGAVGQTYYITNMGTTGVEYFSFNLTVGRGEPGDKFLYRWNMPDFLNSQMGIYQVKDSNSTDVFRDGINSGPPVASGGFDYIAKREGRYTIYSGATDEYGQVPGFYMTLIINPKQATSRFLTVKVSGQEAVYNVGGADDPVNTGCPYMNTDIDGSTSQSVTKRDASRFSMAFAPARTPVVTGLSFLNATSHKGTAVASTVLTAKGRGFSSTNACTNEVKLGGYDCNVTVDSTTQFTCVIESPAAIPVGQALELSVNVLGYGYAQINTTVSQSVTYLHVINNVNPTSGSTKGGRVVTASGTNLNKTTSVRVGGVLAEFKVPTDNSESLLVTLPETFQPKSPVVAFIGNLASVCDGDCNVTYSQQLTPTVAAVTPGTVDGETLLTFSGTLFGSSTSAIEVTLAEEPCVVEGLDSSGNSLNCTVAALPAGKHVPVLRNEFGFASVSDTVQVVAVEDATGVNPSKGSIYGGTRLTLAGHGFYGETNVTADGLLCTEVAVTLTQLTLLTPPHDAGTVPLSVVSNNVTFPTVNFTYASESTPTILGIAPSPMTKGDTVMLTGERFDDDEDNVAVAVGNYTYNATFANETHVQFVVGAQASGDHEVRAVVDGKGRSNNVSGSYQIQANNVSPSEGPESGGQPITVSGGGFSPDVIATVCDNPCPLHSVSDSLYVCLSPPGSVASNPCAVKLKDRQDADAVTAGSYSYNTSPIPHIHRLVPAYGGTGGGTMLTAYGTGFSGSVLAVSIAESVCIVDTAASNATQIVCQTGAHSGTISALVALSVEGIYAQRNASFHYVDRWSSVATWNNGPLPIEGDVVVIAPGQTVLLDQDTPILSMLLVNGGNLIFDETKSLTLNAKIIFINNGGSITAGTEEKPYEGNLTFMLHGHPRDPELPIYGTKTLAVRNGTLDLHGIPRVPWTSLAETAEAGSYQVTLQRPVNWRVGDLVVIATTGDRSSQKETETRYIASISDDDMTVTFTEPLKYKHIAVDFECSTPSGISLDRKLAAEIGLLSRNIVIEGSDNKDWHNTVEACEDGFDTGEFATQTCFQGRFGEEMVNDEFGAHVLVHALELDLNLARVRIEHTEFFYVGQAFRLGRYPLHFHLNGNLNLSYLKGSAIHNSFNRAVNTHGSHNIVMEGNVAYDIRGGAFFFEDGIETGNKWIDNLVLFAKSSTSLLNDDITPAAYWITNPNNTIRGNHAVGGTHLGFWISLAEHPTGPSYDPNICPRNTELGTFENNTAHSMGWFCLWIFETYTPAKGSGCSSSTPAPAYFKNVTTWNCKKGVEWVNAGSIHFKNLVALNNSEAAVEGKLNLVRDCRVANLIESCLSGKITASDTDHSQVGFVVPFGFCAGAEDTTFKNLPIGLALTTITGTCTEFCGGFEASFTGVELKNVSKRVLWRWPHEAVFYDMDGSICNSSDNSDNSDNKGVKLMPYSGSHTPPSLLSSTSCTENLSVGRPTVVLKPEARLYRLALHEINPASLKGKILTATSVHGSTSANHEHFRLTHKDGWMMTLFNGVPYDLAFQYAPAMTNISFTGALYNYERVILGLQTSECPDGLTVDGKTWKPTKDPFDSDTENVTTGDWYCKQKGNDWWVYFAVFAPRVSRKKRGSPDPGLGKNDTSIRVQIMKCFYTNCTLPHNTATDAPVDERPKVWQNYNNTDIWDINANGTFYTVPNNGTANQLPTEDSDIIISSTAGANWVVIFENYVNYSTIELFGSLELDFEKKYDFVFRAKNIIIIGGRFVVGWPNNPMRGTVHIWLMGDHSSPPYTRMTGATVDKKVIAAFGGIDLFGRPIGSTWARLKYTAKAGSKSFTLEDGANISMWQENDIVILTSTVPNPDQTERFTVASVDQNSLRVTVKETLQYHHSVFQELVDGTLITFAAVCAILTRRAVVIGQLVPQLGGRTLVSTAQLDGEADVYSGYMRTANTEYQFTAQEGFIADNDYRASVSFFNAPSSTNRPSGIYNCSFHELYGTAIALVASHNVPVHGNVIYGSVGDGIYVSNSRNVSLVRNAVVNTKWSANNRNEPSNIRWDAAFHAIYGIENLTLMDNYGAGSQRIVYRVAGEDCDLSLVLSRYKNNWASSSLMGVCNFVDDPTAGTSCTRYSSFRTFNNVDFGIYINTRNEVELYDYLSAGDPVGAFIIVVGPSAKEHIRSDKEVKINNSTFIGALSQFDRSSFSTPTGYYYTTTTHCRAPTSPSGGGLGLVEGTFTSGSNMAPLKPCANIMAYMTLGGKWNITGNKFKNYGPYPDWPTFAIATNPYNDDGSVPIYMSETKVENVYDSHKFLIHRPRLGQINPSDCNDMDCDGLKKASLRDEDGTFLGFPGTVIAESEFEWDGDRRRGLGDYRFPTAMLTDPVTGNRIDPQDIATFRGIRRSGGAKRSVTDCRYMKVPSENTASWWCMNALYEYLVIESMDDDTETRRLSPVAVVSNNYIDLLNGPQDHGWCSGYFCNKRLSTFFALFRPGDEVQVYMTGTNPKSTRFFIVDGGPTSCFIIAFYFTNPNRIDIFIGERGDTQVLPMEDIRNPSSLSVTCDDPHGSNFLDRRNRMVHFVLKGNGFVLVVKADVITVHFNIPAMSIEEFFGSGIVSNIALLLGIRTDQIKVVDIVPESNRRKRSTDDSVVNGGVNVTMEIGDPQAESASETTQVAASSAVESLLAICQMGSLDNVLETTGASCNSIAVGDYVYTIAEPSEMRFIKTLVAQHEGVPLATQPQIRAYDALGVVVENLGIEGYLWEITATIRNGTGHGSAILSGATTITAIGGWFNFTDLAISHAGSGYILDFNITAPASAAATNLSISSAEFTIEGVPLVAGLNAITAGYITLNNPFSITLELRDNSTGQQMTNITWRNHTFTTTCGLVYSPSSVNLTGTLTKTFDTTTGTALFDDLVLTAKGLMIIACRIVSTPAEYDFMHYEQITVYNAEQAAVIVESSMIVQIRFLVDFHATVGTEAAQNQLLMATGEQLIGIQDNVSPQTRIKDYSIREGSIIITFTIEGGTTNVTILSMGLCTNLSSGIDVTIGSVTLTLDQYMTVDGVNYIPTCGTTKTSSDDDDGLHPGFIALIVVVAVLVLVIVALLLIWKFKIHPKTKTHGRRFSLRTVRDDNGRTVFLGGANQRVEDIFYKKKGATPRNPSAMAAPVTTLYDDIDVTDPTPVTRESPQRQGYYKEWTMATPDA